MSESGEIPLSSMTPERIEEKKRNFKAGSPWWFMIKKGRHCVFISLTRRVTTTERALERSCKRVDDG